MHANDKSQYDTHTTLQNIRIQQTTSEGNTSEAPIHQPMGILVTLLVIWGTSKLVYNTWLVFNLLLPIPSGIFFQNHFLKTNSKVMIFNTKLRCVYTVNFTLLLLLVTSVSSGIIFQEPVLEELPWWNRKRKKQGSARQTNCARRRTSSSRRARD